jgi:phosphoesterase RecJ-like protein
MPINWLEFVATVHAHQRFLLTSHIRPDCDALGSELGMAAILEALDKHVVIVNGQGTPPNLAFLDPGHRIKQLHEDIKAQELDGIEVLIVLDTSAWVQLGPMADVVRQTRAKKIVLDHHISEDDLGAVTFKDATAEATGRLVVEAAAQLGVPLTDEMAKPLFAAVATDTGWFRFPSTSGETYRLAAQLVSAGANPAAIYAALYEQETLGRSRLRGIILSRLETELDGRLVHTYVRRDDFAAAGALPTDTEDAINLALAVSGTEFAVIWVELLSGGIKISFRSRSHLDCSAIAAEFGGGGHKAAAGAYLNQPFETARQRVLDRVRAAMDTRK